MLEKTITVKGIEQVAKSKPGVAKAWIMYRVTDQDDLEYKTFDVLSLGAPYAIKYTEEPRKPFTNKEGKYIEPKGVERFIKEFRLTDSPPVPVSNSNASQGQMGHITKNMVPILTIEELSFQVFDHERRLKVLEGKEPEDF